MMAEMLPELNEAKHQQTETGSRKSGLLTGEPSANG